MKRRRTAVTYLIAVLAAVPAYAQEEPGVTEGQEEVSTYEVDPMAAVVPFGPGERLEYQVKLGPFSVGGAMMQVVDVEPVRGHPSYYVSWLIKGGLPLARVDDHFESWIDVETLATRRSLKKVREVREMERTLCH